MTNLERVVSAESFCAALFVNVENEEIEDSGFREFVRKTLPIVDFPRSDPEYVQERVDQKNREEKKARLRTRV